MDIEYKQTETEEIVESFKELAEAIIEVKAYCDSSFLKGFITGYLVDGLKSKGFKIEKQK